MTRKREQFPVPGKLQSLYRHPWLIYNRGAPVHRQTFYDISSSSSSEHIIPQLRDRIVLYCSPNGERLILYHNTGIGRYQRYLVWSPMSDESIWLPHLRPDLQHRRILQAFISSTSSLVLLSVSDIPLILYCRVGDTKWREFNYAPSIQAQTGTALPQSYFLRSAVDFNGKIYATAACYRDLVQISVDDKHNCETRLLMPEQGRACVLKKQLQKKLPHYSRTFLVSLGAVDLCLIIMSPRCYDRYREVLVVSILKFDFSSNSWQKMTSLNGGAVFLCFDYALYSSQGDIVGSSNKWSYIYFNFPEDPTLFSYRIEDEKLTSYESLFRPNPRDIGNSVWLMPPMPADDYHRLDIEQDCPGTVNGGIAYFWKNCKRRSTTSKSRRLMKVSEGSVTVASDDGSSSLCNLSQEVLSLIAENLCFVDYMHFRCVNKLCASSTVRMRLNPFPPCLIYKERSGGVYNILDSNLNQKLCVKMPDVPIDCDLLLEEWLATLGNL